MFIRSFATRALLAGANAGAPPLVYLLNSRLIRVYC